MKTFAKAQLSAFLGGIVDYLVMLFFTEIVGIFYTYSIVVGGIIGAIVNFSLNRMWTFNATDTKKRVQLPKFVLMVAGSILLKSSGTYAFTNYFGIDYKISRIIVDLVVSLGFNFTLQKLWVFKSNHSS
jgi:putative flippase GtrA